MCINERQIPEIHDILMVSKLDQLKIIHFDLYNLIFITQVLGILRAMPFCKVLG